jgi:hypothetical protein
MPTTMMSCEKSNDWKTSPLMAGSNWRTRFIFRVRCVGYWFHCSIARAIMWLIEPRLSFYISGRLLDFREVNKIGKD